MPVTKSQSLTALPGSICTPPAECTTHRYFGSFSGLYSASASIQGESSSTSKCSSLGCAFLLPFPFLKILKSPLPLLSPPLSRQETFKHLGLQWHQPASGKLPVCLISLAAGGHVPPVASPSSPTPHRLSPKRCLPSWRDERQHLGQR